MPRLALRIDPRGTAAAGRALADRWEALLGGSGRPVQTSRTVKPDVVAVNVLLGFFPNAPQPACSEDETILVWLDGEIWDHESARERAAVADDEQLSDTELCLRLYLKLGDAFCERLNGQFVIAVYDTVRRRLLLCNDRHGFRPVFWQTEADRFTCATEIKSLLAASERTPALDPAGVLELFAYGHQFGERTLFRSIQALPPGARLVFANGVVEISRYWRFTYADAPRRVRECDLLDDFEARLRRACTRQAVGPARVGMALSGGLDSRMICAALPQTTEARPAYTTGYPDSLDVDAARQLAQTFGMQHTHLVPEEGYLGRIASEVVWRTEGCFSFVDATSLQFHPRLREELDVIVTGHSGGALSGQTLRPGSTSWEAIERMLSTATIQTSESSLRALIRDDVWASEWPAAQRRFSASVEELRSTCSPRDAVITWNMERRQPRFTHHSAQADRYDFEVRAPFLDHEMVEFFQALPYRYRFAQRFYKLALANRFPAAAAIPWAKTGRPVPGSTAEILSEFYLGGAARQIVKRVPFLAKRKKDRVRTCRVIADEMRRGPQFRDEILEPFIAGPHFPDWLLNRDRARTLVQEHWAGDQNHWHELACLATLALAIRHFATAGIQAPAVIGTSEAGVPLQEAA
ncbi:MAG: asparagine synthase-related protein [Actinomycetota bacterium]